MRYNDRVGDPTGFSHSLIQKKLGRGFIKRARGNRIHLYFKLSQIYTVHHEDILEYLESYCGTTNAMRKSLIHDFKLPECRLRFKCAAMFGDIFARSWMKKFYVAADTSLTHMEAYQLVLDAMDHLKTMIAAFDVDRLTCDVFGNAIEKHTAIWKLDAAEKANGSIIVMKMLEKTLDVLERQYLPYTKLNLEEAAKDTRATPTHNMGAEEIVGLFSAAQDRAPNATILFLNSKIKARRNRTITKLQELSDDKRSGMIKAAIIIAKQEKKKSIRYASV